MPFLGVYERADFIGLLEILSDAGAPAAGTSGDTIALLTELLAQYHAAPDKARFRAGHPHPFARADWFANRYSEWLDFRAVSEGTDLAGRRVLDVGAGSGFGTWSLAAAGARVTALEYNPALAARGRATVPEARWLGGLSHVLPFREASFDVVCCNAALHHMRDIPQAMAEMLRVLAPGGALLTSGDPFRSDASSEAEELALFDRHPAVLGGINETVPRAGALTAVLAEHADGLAARCWLRDLHGPFAWALRLGLAPGGWRRDASGIFAVAAGTRRNLARISRLAGTIAIRAEPRRPLAIAAARHGPPLVAPGAFAASFALGEAALARLAALAPEAFIDRPFPGEAPSRFDLLNGWQMPEPGSPERRAWHRARWFLRRPAAARALGLRARAATAQSGASRSIAVRLDGQAAGRWPIDAAGWTDIAVGLEQVPPGRPFVCELRLEGVPEDAQDFDAWAFAIRDRTFTATAERGAGP